MAPGRASTGSTLRRLLAVFTAAAWAWNPAGNARADVIPPGCMGNGYGIALFVDQAAVRVGDVLKYSVHLGNQPLPACQAEQITASVITPDGVQHPLTLTRTTLDPGESDFYSEVVSYVVRQQDITNQVVKAAAISTALINQSVTGIRSDNYRDVSTPVLSSCLDLTATCDGGTGESGLITFAGTVRNCGTTPLTNVTVRSSVNGQIIFGPIPLASGEARAFSSSFAPPDPCSPATVTLTAQGQDNLAPVGTVTDSANVTCQLATTPRIEIRSACPVEAPPAGGLLTYTGTLRNTGNVTLTDLQVTSDRAAGDRVVFRLATLAPGAEAGFTGNFTAPTDACSVSDTLTVTARSRCTGAVLTERTTKTCPLDVGGAVALTVNCPASPGSPGQTVVCSGTVRNPGSVTLHDLEVVNDAAPSAPVLRLSALAPGQAANFNAQVRIGADACSFTAAFTATATDPCRTGVVRDTAALTCPVNTAPAIAVTHECPITVPSPGTSTSLAGTVRNAGNIALTNVVVVSGEVRALGPITLEPGQSANFVVNLVVPADTCSLNTTVTAAGADVCSGRTVTQTSTRTCPVRTSPAVDLAVRCPPDPVMAGASLVYAGSVRNAGDVTLTEVVVNRSGHRIFGPATLAPGAAAEFTTQITAPSNACTVSENWESTARDRCTGVLVVDNAGTACALLTEPRVTLTVNCPGGQLTPGAKARYGGTIRNSGNITLTDLVVVNTSAPNTPVFQAPNLAPGASVNFAADVAVPFDVCTLTAQFSVSAGNTCSAPRVSQSAAATCPVASSPQLALSQSCPPNPGAPGTGVTFNGSVRNSGNVTLNNVTVTSSLAGTTPVFGPITLAPAQTVEFTASYTVPPDLTSCTYRHTLTATGRDPCSSATVNATSNTDCPTTHRPEIRIVSACPEQAVAPGQRLTYTASVQNRGSVGLRRVRVTDSQTGEQVIFSMDTLAPGATQTFTGSFIVPDDCCAVTHTLTATAEDVCASATTRDTSTTTCPVLYTRALALTKQCPTAPVGPGDAFGFTGTVRNTGNITLVDVMVRVRVRGEVVPVIGPIALAPGQVVNFQARYAVPLDFCGNDELVATGRDLCAGQEVTANLTAPCQTAMTPMIAVVQHCPTEPVPRNGLFVYSGTVLNLGNVTLTNVTVVHSVTGEGAPVLGPITLAPGALANFTGSHTVDAACCWVVDSLTARGQDVCSGRSVTNTATAVCEVRYAPALELTKQCLGSDRFVGLVKNSGNIVLSNVIVSANLDSGTLRLLGPLELALGETATFEGTAATDVVVTASGVPLCGATPATAAATCAGPVLPTPAFTDIFQADNQVVLRWSAIPGRTYRVQYTHQLGATTWQALPGDVTATGTVAERRDALGTDPRRFYRVLLLP